MQDFHELDLDKIWRKTMGWSRDPQATRQFDDQIESDFWVQLAPRYTAEYNINKDTPLVAQKLAELLGSNKTILEIGCGSGNFTVLMAAYAKQILGLDFSAAMLSELQKRIDEHGLSNIHTQVGKWEEFDSPAQFDYIVSVNSLYRICDMRQALRKMHTMAKQGFIIVRTIQCPFLTPLYTANQISLQHCLDHQLMPLLLWRDGINAHVEFVNYQRHKSYDSLDSFKAELLSDLGQEQFDRYSKLLIKEFTSQASCDAQGYTITMPRTTVFIHHKK